MPERLPDLLSACHCHVKAEWVIRLRSKPPTSALAHADILVYRMDETLKQLFACLSHRRAVVPVPGKSSGRECEPLGFGCACSLNPLLDFFVTGDEALQEVLPELSEAQQVELNRAWHMIAQSEIETLCSACCRARADCPMGNQAKV